MIWSRFVVLNGKIDINYNALKNSSTFASNTLSVTKYITKKM